MAKTIIYQLLPRLWNNSGGRNLRGGSLEENGCGKFSGIDRESLEYIKRLSATHVWLTGVPRHATADSPGTSDIPWIKGRAGSPYSVTDWFDVNPYLADDSAHRMEEFEALVGRIHGSGLKVIIDFVPNHVARDYGRHNPAVRSDGTDAEGHPVFGSRDDSSVHWKAGNDFFYYPGEALRLPDGKVWEEFPAKASGNCFSPSPGRDDWYDTVKLNYCDFHTETWDKMYAVLDFWAAKGVDGFRCDMVELVPRSFLKWLISSLKLKYPQLLFIAEVYEKGNYREYVENVGFDYLYDKSGLYDSLRAVSSGSASCRTISRNWQFLGDLQSSVLNFLENHDEQRIASDFFLGDAHRAFAAMHVSLLMNRGAFMLYAGQEIGERGMDEEGMSGLDGRTSIFDWWSVESLRSIDNLIHRNVALDNARSDLLWRYRSLLTMAGEAVFSEGGFFDLCYCNTSANGFDQDRHYAFLRCLGNDCRLVAANFSTAPASVDIAIPQAASECFSLAADALPSSVHVEMAPMDAVVLKFAIRA